MTPPVSCGLLPGTFRAHLLDEGTITEQVLRREDLARATAAWMVNAVRGWVEIDVDTSLEPAAAPSLEQRG